MSHRGHPRGPVLLAVAVALVGTGLLAAAPQVRVRAVVTEGRVVATFNAIDTWTIESRETLQFGSVVTYDYYVELRRPATLWDKTLAQTNLKAEAKFDTLTGKYTVSRHRDGRMLRSEKRDAEGEVRDWLTVFDEPVELRPESALKANTEYYVQVRLLKYPRRSVSLWSVLPGGSEDAAGRSAPFTYLR